MLLTAGRPCGPCCGIRKAMYLRKACLFIALFEIFFGCFVVGACLGTAITLRWHKNELIRTAEYNEMNFYWLSFQCTYQSFCYFLFACLGGILMRAHINRSIVCCGLWIAGVVVVTVASFIGMGFTFTTLFAFDALVILHALLRFYFIWVITAYYLEIKMYPDGFPPPPRPVVVVKEAESEIKVKESSVRYLGDG